MHVVLQGATSWAICLAAASCNALLWGKGLGSCLACVNSLHVWLMQPVSLLYASSPVCARSGALQLW